MTSHELENRVVLATVNALIGAITPSVAAISVKVDEEAEKADFFVAMKEADPIFEEYMRDDFVADMTVLTDDAVYISVTYWLGERWFEDWPGKEHRMIYGAYVR